MRSLRSSCRTLSRGALVAVALAFAVTAEARGERTELAELASPPVELTAPVAGAALVGGATAELAWRPASGFDALAGATEWEAFLSVDGGKSYPVRLTPHLDLGRRRFEVQVPDLPSEDVRLLLRIGDERAERAVRFATRLRIVRPTSPAAATIETAFAAPSAEPGEPALPGGAGVLFWVEGDRDGKNLRRRSAVPPGARSAADPMLLAGGPEALGCDDSDGLHLGARPAPATHPETNEPPTRLAASAEPLTDSDILLLIRRRNE